MNVPPLSQVQPTMRRNQQCSATNDYHWFATLFVAYGSVATPEILEAAVFVVRWRGWCGDYRQGRSQLLHYPRQEGVPGLRSLRTWRHLGGLKELGMLQHFFSSTSLVYLCVTWFHKPWSNSHWHDKSSKFKVQSLTWLEHARATVWCNTPPHVDGHVQLAVLVKNTRRNPSTADSLLLLLPQTYHGRRWRISESFLSYTSLFQSLEAITVAIGIADQYLCCILLQLREWATLPPCNTAVLKFGSGPLFFFI